MIRHCPECGGSLIAKLPTRPAEEPGFDEATAPTLLEDAARSRSEGADHAHAATDLVCATCGAVTPRVAKDGVFRPEDFARGLPA